MEGEPLFNGHVCSVPDQAADIRQHSPAARDQAAEQPNRSKAARAKACASSASVLSSVGLVLLAVGAALIVTGLVVPQSRNEAPSVAAPAAPTRDAEGVPLDSLAPVDPGDVHECEVQLGDWQRYADAAAVAEAAMLPSQVTNLSEDEVAAALQAAAPLQVPLLFWVLASPKHPWSDGFIPAAEAQATVLNAAYNATGLRFRFDGIFSIPAKDEDVVGCADSTNAAVTQLLASLHGTSPAVHVVLCEPAGTNGATVVLGGEAAGRPRDVVLLRRSALWQSRTSLVHQMGHYLGLAHPFPDQQSCKYDADTVLDTPQQYQGDAGCDAAAPLPLCDAQAKDMLLREPRYNFMDTTNDTCRRQFTPGQALRVRAMLHFLRGALEEAALELHRRQAIPMVSASQSSLPPITLLQQQMQLAAEAAASGGDSNGGDRSPPGGHAQLGPEASVQLTSALGHAALAVSNNGSASVESCSCVGLDSRGATFWTGDLGASYFLDAVRILQPWQVLTNATLQAESLDETEDKAAANGSRSLAPLVELRVGDSVQPGDNARCTARPVRLDTLMQTVSCQQSLSGRYLSVVLVPDSRQQAPAPLAGQDSVWSWPLCLCKVVPLSFVAPPQLAPAAAPSAVPGVLLNLSGAAAAQSSSVDSPAAAALGPAQPGVLDACTSTEAEAAPWWSLDTGMDPVLVHGLRLLVPFSANTTAAASAKQPPMCCTPLANVTLDVYVTDAPLELGSIGRPDVPAEVVCVRGASVLPGQLTDLNCGRFLQGRVVTVVARPPTPAALALCGVQPIGGLDLQLVGAMLPEVQVEPSELQPDFAAAVDGYDSTCLDVVAAGEVVPLSKWELRLARVYPILAAAVTAQGSAITVSLLDESGQGVWSAKSNGSGDLVVLPGAVDAARLVVAGFASLCEVRLVTGSQDVAQGSRLIRSSADWTAAASSDGSASINASAAIDGGYRSCAGSKAALRVSFGRVLTMSAVQLVSNSSASNVTVGVLPADKLEQVGDDAAAWAEAALPCAEDVELEPWRARVVSCQGDMQGAGLIISRQHSADHAAPLVVCDISVEGRPL